MFTIGNIVGLSIVTIKSDNLDKRKRCKEPTWILFNDKKTFISLEEQDYYTYHDCDSSARILRIVQDPIQWKHLKENYPDATEDI